MGEPRKVRVTTDPAYDVMLRQVHAGHYVALIPAHDTSGDRCVYHRWAPVTRESMDIGFHPNMHVRARFALGLCHGSRQLAERAGLRVF